MRPRISIRGSVRRSVGPSVRPSVVGLAFFFQIAEIGKSDKTDKSKPEILTNLTESDKSLSAIQS